MKLLDFLPYFHRHIKFQYKGQWKTGIVLDEIPYIFIQDDNINEWRISDINDDQDSKDKLQEIIDINEIRNPEIYNPDFWIL